MEGVSIPGTMSAPIDRLWGVIPAGGSGTRLWPLSRSASPKFLLDLTGSGRTLLQQTCDRLMPLLGDRLLVVTGAAHATAVGEQVEVVPKQILVEPVPRDSMAAIGWAAAILERRDPNALLGSFAADHVIDDHDAFAAGIREASEVADQGYIVTLGIRPSFPSTAFGYIEGGEPLAGFAMARVVTAFVEKPDAQRAAEYVASGRFLWNGGMFITRAGVLLDELALTHPDLAKKLREIAADPASLADRWPDLTKVAIDHAVAEPAAARGRVAVVPGQFSWADLGDFDSLAKVIGDDQLTVMGEGERVVALDASGFIATGQRQVCVIGLDDVVVVDTDDVVLVMSRTRAQDVKKIVELIKAGPRPYLA